jgi:hypothetical protein
MNSSDSITPQEKLELDKQLITVLLAQFNAFGLKYKLDHRSKPASLI